jgi:hypothetical protein
MTPTFRNKYAELSTEALQDLGAKGQGTFTPDAWSDLQAEIAERRQAEPEAFREPPPREVFEAVVPVERKEQQTRPLFILAGLFLLILIPGSVLGDVASPTALAWWAIVAFPAFIGGARLAVQAYRERGEVRYTDVLSGATVYGFGVACVGAVLSALVGIVPTVAQATGAVVRAGITVIPGVSLMVFGFGRHGRGILPDEQNVVIGESDGT